MKKYDNYKESGIQWIGEIPNKWKISKLCYFTEIYRGSGYQILNEVDEDFEGKKERVLRIGDFNNYNPIWCEYKLQFENYRIKENDLLIGGTGHYFGKSLFVSKEMVGLIHSYNIIRLVINKQFSKYISYWLSSELIREQMDISVLGSGQPFIDIQGLKDLKTIIPSIKEQITIASFLDYKTNLIDAAIEKKKRLIALLKEKRQAVINEAVTKGLNPNVPMKDSGVEWLGEIPEHWKVTFLKRFCDKITDGAHFSPKTEFEGKNYISVKDVDEFGNIDLINCKKINEDDFNDLVKNGCQPNLNDVLITKDGTIGRAAIVTQSNDFVALSSLGIISPNQLKLNSEFLRYYLISEINVNQMYSMIAGAALTRLTIDKLKHLIITLPDLNEQLKIIFYLNNTVPKFNSLISLVEGNIEKLQTYRQSLISEAVTGKIDVRDWQSSTKNR